MAKIAIIGAGITGLCSAYYLSKSGHDVSIYDSGEIGKECSYGNAGLIVPSHFETLANPGILKKGIKWMLNSNSPFYLKPRCDMDLLKWLVRFNLFCTKKHVENNKYFLRDINLYSHGLYNDLYKSDDLDFELKHSGLLILCKEEKTLIEEQSLINESWELGLDASMLNKEELNKLEPNVNFDCIGASYYKCDSKIQPYDFMQSIIKYLKKSNVQIYENCEITDFDIKDGEIQSLSNSLNEKFSADEFVLSSGILAFDFAKKLDLNLTMQAGKGFSFRAQKNTFMNFSTPLILAEQKVAVSPYDEYVRFGGTMMICGNDLSIDENRVNNIRKAANSYIKDLNLQNNQTYDMWAGLRPCSPDGLPYIGKSKKYKNLTVATGHAMMGVSLGPASGKIVDNLINGNKNDIDISFMDIHRFT